MIYFIQRGAGGPIKIGHTNGDPRTRRSSLQTMSPERLEILAVVSGGPLDERSIHKTLAAHRISGEWFEPHEMVFALMQEETPLEIQPQRNRIGKAVGAPIRIELELIERVKPLATAEERYVDAQVNWLLAEALDAREKRARK